MISFGAVGSWKERAWRISPRSCPRKFPLTTEHENGRLLVLRLLLSREETEGTQGPSTACIGSLRSPTHFARDDNALVRA